MKVVFFLFAYLFTALLTTPGFAAVEIKKSFSQKLNQYVKSGSVVGGRSGVGFSLLNVRRDYSQKHGIERVVIDLGDLEGKPLKDKVSFFQLQVSQFPPRAILDLSQVQRSGLDEKILQKRFAKSPYVRKIYLSYDPEDLSTNMVFEFKKEGVAVKATELKSSKKSSRLVLDFKKSG